MDWFCYAYLATLIEWTYRWPSYGYFRWIRYCTSRNETTTFFLYMWALWLVCHSLNLPGQRYCDSASLWNKRQVRGSELTFIRWHFVCKQISGSSPFSRLPCHLYGVGHTSRDALSNNQKCEKDRAIVWSGRVSRVGFSLMAKLY